MTKKNAESKIIEGLSIQLGKNLLFPFCNHTLKITANQMTKCATKYKSFSAQMIGNSRAAHKVG